MPCTDFEQECRKGNLRQRINTCAAAISQKSPYACMHYQMYMTTSSCLFLLASTAQAASSSSIPVPQAVTQPQLHHCPRHSQPATLMLSNAHHHLPHNFLCPRHKSKPSKLADSLGLCALNHIKQSKVCTSLPKSSSSKVFAHLAVTGTKQTCARQGSVGAAAPVQATHAHSIINRFAVHPRPLWF
jgi:hypothetical protein